MANVKISALPVNATLDGTEEIAIVQGGTTKKVLVSTLATAVPVLTELPVVAKSGATVLLTCPATTFTATTASSAAGGANTLLTSSGVHGMTGAKCVGATIYISSGTGWTPGFHTITAIAVDTTGVSIQIGTPFSGQGTPTISLAGTEVTLGSVAIPVLLANSVIDFKVTFEMDNDGIAKTFAARLGGQSCFYVTTSSSANATLSRRIHNKNTTGNQTVTFAANTATSYGTNATMLRKITADTSVPTTLDFSVVNSAADTTISLQMYLVNIYK